MKQATLCFLLDGNRVLLGMKKRGLGAGRWNGIGGGVEPGESVLDAARREVQEEIGVRADNIEKVGMLRFYFPDEPQFAGWNQEVHVYLAREWVGEPGESDEMAPQWHAIEEIPFDNMWADDAHWLPRILAGERLFGEFHFSDGNTVAEFLLRNLIETGEEA